MHIYLNSTTPYVVSSSSTTPVRYTFYTAQMCVLRALQVVFYILAAET